MKPETLKVSYLETYTLTFEKCFGYSPKIKFSEFIENNLGMFEDCKQAFQAYKKEYGELNNETKQTTKTTY